MNIYGVVGWKNAGKTTLMERLVAEFCARGARVSTIKHAHHSFDVDQPGKDSHRHRQAGAQQVLLASHTRWALMSELRDRPEPTLTDMLAKLDPVDLVLVEGYKRDSHAKIEVWRDTPGRTLLAPEDPTIRAVASPRPIDGLHVPWLPLDEPAAVADFIAAELALTPGVA
ncbi:molybdopterin-guanine dinucleotide biosynthesis protein B [Oceanomicrobium pacificus]|uniref:Molybdopterin-guanine dinucleotide biosynthesis protein B n=1 Tax=Oceanomicrobium pacificus TaxID=2692916 RepID=A0A6B0TS33_9RHOB|nr:molybdopterin-guanine dinucleotide biosynthesis protein B [Oceanomicrobium pacificus]MXU64012.1 molybdopterin-guanine dinucleotide biosynthesis protein B [Oceanomicrobium pacificus]